MPNVPGYRRRRARCDERLAGGRGCGYRAMTLASLTSLICSHGRVLLDVMVARHVSV
jgi:hypothetical protein